VQVADLSTSEQHQQWWLLGTVGCHLCEVAKELLSQLSAVQVVNYRYVDIADFDEDLMMQFATTIPVILTPTQRLNYPFSVLDLQQL
jgi:glutaredoxin